MSKYTKGKEAEKFTDNFFTKWGFHYERLKDSHDAGRMLSGNTADAVTGKDGFMMYVEVKSTIKKSFTRSMLTKDQLRRNLSACRKGVFGSYVIFTDGGMHMHIYEWSQVLLFFAKKKGSLTKSLQPAYECHFDETYTEIKRYPDRLRLNLMEAHSNHASEIKNTVFDFGDKSKYRKLKP